MVSKPLRLLPFWTPSAPTLLSLFLDVSPSMPHFRLNAPLATQGRVQGDGAGGSEPGSAERHQEEMGLEEAKGDKANRRRTPPSEEAHAEGDSVSWRPSPGRPLGP